MEQWSKPNAHLDTVRLCRRLIHGEGGGGLSFEDY